MRGVRRLLAAQLRRDRWQLALWAAGIGLLVFAATTAVSAEFASERDRQGLVAIAATNPAFLFLRGVPDGIGFGALLFFQMFAFLAVLAGLMGTFLVVRHSRADEELGRAELIGATPAPRTAPLVATLLLALIANSLVGSAVAVGMLAGAIEPLGAVLTGAAVAAAGVVFAATAAIAAQLLPTSRGANGVAASIVGLAYLVRGIGDALATPGEDLTSAESAWPSWLSPIGWAQRVAPFGDADPRPLLLALGVAALLAVLAVRLRANRDLGSSLIGTAAGRPRGGRLLRSSPGLAFRLHLPTLVGWAVAAAVLGVFAGALSPTVAEALESNAALSELVRRLSPSTRGDAVDLFATAILGVSGALAAASGIQAMLRLRGEETEDRAELMLAAPLRRSTWMLSHAAVAALSVAVVAASAGLAAGTAFAATGLPHRFGSSLLAAFAHVPAALIFVSLVAVVFAVLPRMSVPFAWGLLILGLVVGQFGDLLRLPGAVQSLSPFAHSPALPAGELDPAPLAVMSGIALLIATAGVWAFRRRDVPS